MVAGVDLNTLHKKLCRTNLSVIEERCFWKKIMKPGKETQYAITGAISLATAAVGILSAWSTPMISKIVRGETSFKITDLDDFFYWLRYSTPLGILVGCVIMLCVCCRYGRRHILMFSAASSFCGTILAITLNHVWMLYAMFVLWGVSYAMVKVAVTLYLAEIADPGIRGRLYAITRTMYYAGILFVVGFGSLVSYRGFNFWLIFLPLIYLAACFKIPESPYYLVKCNQVEQAKNYLLILQKDASVDIELETIKTHVQMEMNDSGAFFGLFKAKNLKAFVIVYGLRLIQLMSGTSVVQSYYFDFLEESNIRITINEMFLIFLSVECVGGIISAILVDFVGRRKLLICTYLGCCVCLTAVGLYYYLRDVAAVELKILRTFGLVLYIGILLFVFISSIGCYTLLELLAGEMFAINLRLAAIVILRCIDLIAYPTSIMYREIENKTGRAGLVWTFALVAFIGAVFTYFALPETKGKSLKEIQELLHGGAHNENGVEMVNTNDSGDIYNTSI